MAMEGSEKKYFYQAVAETAFFELIDKVEIPSPEQMADALSAGLLSREGEPAFIRFKARIARFAKDFTIVWKKARCTQSFGGVSAAVKFFINHINTRDVVDKEYPLFRFTGYFKNTFSYVRILKSLSCLCAGDKGATEFLQQLIIADPSNFFYHTALAQLLLQQGKYTKAADFALEAKRLRSIDLCVSKTVISTQKALSDNQMAPNIKHVFSNNSDRFCKLPFTLLNVFSRSVEQPLAFGLCRCRGWMPMIFAADFSWNGHDAQELRRSILNGSFRYCNELRCPFLVNNNLPKRENVKDAYMRKIIDGNITELPKGPEDIVLGYDRSCNLCCPSCRDKVYVADFKTTQFLNRTMDTILPPLLADAKTLRLSQVGEALASPHYRYLLKSITPWKYPHLRINLLTNLKLISQKTWDELGPTAECIETLMMSIDGATPQTLEKLRRGLTWDRMIEALEFSRTLRKSLKINHIGVTFIIQKENFRELPLMLELCSLYCVDRLSIARIYSHGSYTKEQFMEIDVGDPAHPLNGEYRAVVENFKTLHKQMQDNEREILSLGRSIPEIGYQVI